MSKNKSILYILPLIALVLMSCNLTTLEINRKVVRGEGAVVTQERPVSGYNKISLSGLGEIEITQDGSESLTIEGEENLMEYIITEVNGSTLEIRIKDNVNIIPTQGLKFDLHVKSLEGIAISGVSNVHAAALTADRMDISISGAGNVDMEDLQAQSLSTRSSGTGNFNLAGKVATQEVTISGAGNYDAADLESNSVTVRVSGAGNAQVWAIEALDVTISGIGRVEYYGNPSVSKEISGAGNVNSLGEH